MISIQIKNLDKLNRVTQNVSKLRVGLYGALEKAMADFGNALIRQAKLNVTGGGPTGDGLHVRTGHLRASINAKLDKTDTALRLTLGANTPYARIHEYGGDIRTRYATIHMPKRSYLMPAIEQETPKFIERTKRLLRTVAMQGIRPDA